MDLIARPMPLAVAANLPADAAVKRLYNFHHRCIENCQLVRAAIAYGSRDNMELLKSCQGNRKRLEFYGRYDGSCPVDPEILRWFLDRKSPSYEYRVVPKWLHAKVIWWVGEGVYIGSANMTDRAWNANFEAGMFLTEGEIEHFCLTDELDAFFDGLRANSEQLTEKRYEAQLALWKRRDGLVAQLQKLEAQFNSDDPLLKATESPIAVRDPGSECRRYQAFAKEWESTLQHMRDIADRVAENRPAWIGDDVPKGVQADQFLHAYYYQHVRPGSEKDAHERFFDRHRKDPELAVREALQWWRSGDYDYEHEHRTIHNWAPLIRGSFAKDRILSLSEDEWIAAAVRIHSLGDHAAKVPNRLLGLPETQQDADLKKEAFSRWLWKQRSQGGKTVLETLLHVVWGTGDLTKRLWEGCHDTHWKIPHVKTSILGEIIGWANPTRYPPRNMRTSKGLRALGYPVEVNI